MIINMNGAKAPETPSSVLQEKTVTPETLPTVIGPDAGYDGLTQVTVNPDAQLKAENIRSGKTIFGVAGAFVGEPTAGIDYTGLTGRACTLDLNFPLFISNPFNLVANPTALDSSPFESSRFYYNSGEAEWAGVGYGLGGIAAREGRSALISSSTFIPSAKWFEFSGIMGGETTFKIPTLPKSTIGIECSHVKGTAYLCPVVSISNFNTATQYTGNHNTTSFIDTPTINVIELDHDITLDEYEWPTFTMTLPESNYTYYGYSSSTPKYKSMMYALIPDKIVIS